MACELNQLEMIVNEQVQKLQEQNQTIQSLGESYMQEANERQKLLRQIQESAIESQMRERYGEQLDISTFSHTSNTQQNDISIISTGMNLIGEGTMDNEESQGQSLLNKNNSFDVQGPEAKLKEVRKPTIKNP